MANINNIRALQNFSEMLIEKLRIKELATILIVLNTFTLCLQTYHSELNELILRKNIPIDHWLQIFDWFVLVFFIFEIALRYLAAGTKFWKEKWNIFDFLIVTLSLIGQAPFFASLRIFRVLRMLRLLEKFKALRLISSVMWNSITGSFWIAMLMLLTLMIFAIIGNDLYGATNPELFGNLHLAMHTLFRVAAIYSYDDTVAQLVEKHPYVHFYMIPYFMIMGYVVINFFSGIVIYYLYEVSIEELRRGERETSKNAQDDFKNEKILSDVLIELQHLRREVMEIKKNV